MRNCLICVVGLMFCAGCYREPPQEMSVVEEVESSRGMEQLDRMAGQAAMPNDAVHAKAAGAAEPSNEGPVVTFAGMSLTAPESWIRNKSQSQFVMTEFAIPKAEGDAADGRLTVSSAGGGIAPNIERWKGQFGGAPENSKQETINVEGIEVTLVDFSGTFSDQRGPFAPGEKMESYRMLAAIIPLGGKLYFVKGYGPEKTMAANAEQFQAFIKSLKSM